MRNVSLTTHLTCVIINIMTIKKDIKALFKEWKEVESELGNVPNRRNFYKHLYKGRIMTKTDNNLRRNQNGRDYSN